MDIQINSKQKNQFSFLLGVALLAIVLTSCASSRIIELGNKAALKGAEVSQKGVDVFDLLLKQAEIDKAQQDKLKILTNPSPSTMSLPDTRINDFSKQINLRKRAYQSLLQTYKAFSLLTDEKYADKTKEAVSALQESYNAIEKLDDLPQAIKDKLPEISKSISQAIQAKKIKKHNEILFRLTQAYVLLWDADATLWNEYTDRIYNDYATGLNTVETKRYDTKKIAEDSKENFSDESILVLLYRLEVRNNIIAQKNEIKKNLSDFGKALSELNQLHAELSKANTEITDVIKMVNHIEELLKN